MLKLIFQDEHLVVAHKPAGMLVHRSRLATDRRTMMHVLRDQIGQDVYPIHRLDRGTAGLVLFALDAETASKLGKSMMAQQFDKTYLAIVRGWPPESGTIDHPLEKDGSGEMQHAVTHYQCLAKAEIAVAVDRYATARYSLLSIQLETGRMHQIRRHFAHVRHPILGDRKRGDRHHNRMWREVQGIEGMMLLAWKIKFNHPHSGEALEFSTTPDEPMRATLEKLGLEGYGGQTVAL
jgi:tRNA pseudouridine65 synthase